MPRKASASREITVKTDNDTYILKRPTGPLGWKHFRMLMELETERKNSLVEKRPNPETGELEDYMLPNPKLDELMSSTLDKWVTDILPNVLISHKFDDLLWTEILTIFNAVCSDSDLDISSFRDIQ
jgi:hypothetical protein